MTTKNTVKRSDVGYHGKNANGYYVFSCYSLGLGGYTYAGSGITAAWSAALDYFNAKA